MRRFLSAPALLVILAVVLPFSLLISVSHGVLDIPFASVIKSFFVGLGLPLFEIDSQHQMVMWLIRWPRALLAALVGASLAICGATMQGLFRNPLADPSLIGVSSGASLGAAFAIVLGSSLFSGSLGWFGNFSSLLGAYSVSLFACLGGFISTLLVYRIGTGRDGTSVSTMLLAGIAISALAAALNSLFSYMADDVALRRISVWNMGSLSGANWHRVILSASLLGAVLIILPRFSNKLNILLLGESEARHLGIDTEKLTLQLIAWTALGIGVAVAAAGIIGFVGLVVPHLIRLLIGPDHRNLLPACALLGAILLVLADWLSRTILAPDEIPVGIITALMGAPFFISLLMQEKQRTLLS